MSKKRLRRLAEFPGPIVITEDKDYTWVIETREVDDAGEPFGDWEVWTDFPAEGKKLPQYPEKNPVLAGYLQELRECAFDDQKNVEYRIKLACRLTQELDLAATDPWKAMFVDEE